MITRSARLDDHRVTATSPDFDPRPRFLFFTADSERVLT